MPIVARDDFEIHYEVRGEGAVPLVLVAGLGLDSAPMRVPARILRDDFRCVLIDNRGTGGSSSTDSPFSIDDMADDVIAVLDDLSLDQAHGLGWSMGGSILQSLLIRHPQRIARGVLVSAMPRYTPVQHAWMSGTRAIRSSTESPEVRALLGLPWLFTPRALSRHADAWRLAEVVAGSPGDAGDLTYLHQSAALSGYDARAALGAVSAEVLVLVGAEDVLTPPEQAIELAGLIPGATLEVLPRGGHGLLMEYPEDVLSAARFFLLKDNPTSVFR